MRIKMNDFYSGLWSLSRDFIKFELTIKELELIRSGVLTDLKLADAFKLNDRVEGIEYFERAIIKTSPFIFFKKYLNNEVTYKNYSDYDRFSSISINGQLYNLVVIKFGEMPRIKVYREDIETLIFIRRDKRIFYFAGKLPIKVYEDGNIDCSFIDFKSNLIFNSFDFC